MSGIEENDPPPSGDEEAKALHEIEAAKAEINEGKGEIRHGLALEDRAEHRLEEAEASLEHAHHHRHVLHIQVDGEEYETERHEMTPDEIIREFGGKPNVAMFYLSEIVKPQNISFQGKGAEPIHLRDGMRFMILSIGPATVSDPGSLVGVGAFIAGLKALGFGPKQIDGNANAVYLDYVVPAGSREGMNVRIGVIVPQDFPMTPPTGPYVSPRIHPFQAGGSHPTGGVHAWPQFNGAGGEWQYWSRPCNDWRAGKRDVAAYMAHILKLWATQ